MLWWAFCGLGVLEGVAYVEMKGLSNEFFYI